MGLLESPNGTALVYCAMTITASVVMATGVYTFCKGVEIKKNLKKGKGNDLVEEIEIKKNLKKGKGNDLVEEIEKVVDAREAVESLSS